MLVALVGLFLFGAAWMVTERGIGSTTSPARSALSNPLQKRWLFEFRDMSDPKEVDRMIARFPRAHADGYNGIMLSYNIAKEKAAELKQAAKRYHLDLVAMVMGGAHDRNYEEGLPVKDALFVIHDGTAAFQPDNPTRVVNGDFEAAT